MKRRFSGDAPAALDRERLASLLRRVADAPAHLRWLRVGHGERVVSAGYGHLFRRM